MDFQEIPCCCRPEFGQADQGNAARVGKPEGGRRSQSGDIAFDEDPCSTSRRRPFRYSLCKPYRFCMFAWMSFTAIRPADAKNLWYSATISPLMMTGSVAT